MRAAVASLLFLGVATAHEASNQALSETDKRYGQLNALEDVLSQVNRRPAQMHNRPIQDQVMADLEEVVVQAKTDSAMSEAGKQKVQHSVNGMKSDLERMQTATPEHKHRLQKALKSRLKELKMQMGESTADDRASQSKTQFGDSKTTAVLASLEQVEEEVEQDASMDAEEKAAVRKNVAGMKANLETMNTANPEYKQRLQKALKLRLKELKMQMGKDTPPKSQETKGVDAKRTAVLANLEQVEEEVEQDASMDAEEKAAVRKNVAGMKANLEKMNTANPEYKQRLQKALKLRMKELKMQMSEDTAKTDESASLERKVVKEKPSLERKEDQQHKRVQNNLEQVMAEIDMSTDMSKEDKMDARKNVAGMKANLEKMRSANPEYKQRLQKALKLRMKELKTQMGENNDEQSFLEQDSAPQRSTDSLELLQ